MPEDAAPPVIEPVIDRFRTADELAAALPEILAAPADSGRLDMIVSRPSKGLRRTHDRAKLTLAGGVEGDHWAQGCWLSTDAGQPHPDVQICIMMSRAIRAIAGEPENWPPAGDNLFIDMNLTAESLPAGARLALGSAILEITEEPHRGCASFVARYGRDACAFANVGPKSYAKDGAGAALRLRGVYARVVQDGEIAVGDRFTRI